MRRQNRIAANKDSRNQLVHWQWLSVDDDRLLCFKYSMRPPPGDADVNREQYAIVERADVIGFAEEIHSLNEDLSEYLDVLLILPTWQ